MVKLKIMTRGIIEKFREGLRECLSAWALLGISFVRKSVVEIVTDYRFKERLISSLKFMNIGEAENFTILGEEVEKAKN